MAEDGYGWEKLFRERMAVTSATTRDDPRGGRYHNVDGPIGTFAGGRRRDLQPFAEVIEAQLTRAKPSDLGRRQASGASCTSTTPVRTQTITPAMSRSAHIAAISGDVASGDIGEKSPQQARAT